MNGILIKLKGILNGLSDEELKNYDIWINAYKTVEMVVLDDNSITLVTDSNLLKIEEIIV